MASKVFLSGTRLGLLLLFLMGLDPSFLVSGQSSTVSTPSTSNTNTDSSTSMTPTTMSTLSTTAMTTSTGNSSVNTMLTTSMPLNTANVSWTMTPGGNATWNMTTLFCRSFICNYSNCNNMYNNNNASACPTDKNYCQLMARDDMTYVVSCTTVCAAPCDNNTAVNCSKGCCNTTNCLAPTFSSMMPNNMTETTMLPSTSKAPTTMNTIALTTTISTGKCCHKGTCNNKVDCYKDFTVSSMCLSTLMHCELKKETSGSTVTWTAGCVKDCSTATWCTATTTATTCDLECCNATTTSCLKLTGNLNVPSSATRGQRLPSELLFVALLASLLSLKWLV